MNRKKILFSGIFLFFMICSCGGYFLFQGEKKSTISDAEVFANEYHEVSPDHVFVSKTYEEIVNIMEHGTGVVYLGYPECPWCQYYVKYLNEVAKEVGLDKIYYANTKKIKEENMDYYHHLISILDGHLQFNNEGEQWIYVPNVSFHIGGNIIFNDYETSKDTHGLKNPEDYWNDEEIKELKKALTTAMKKVKEASEVCTDCNK